MCGKGEVLDCSRGESELRGGGFSGKGWLRGVEGRLMEGGKG